MAITVVQSTGPAAYVSATSQGQAFGSSNTAGNCLMMSGVVGTTTPGSIAVSDTQSNSGWTLIQTVTISTIYYCQTWVCFNCKAGANTVTFSGGSGATFVSISAIAEISGVHQVDPNFNTNGGTGANWVGPSVTPTEAASIVITLFETSAVAGPTISSGTAFATFTNSYNAVGYKILSSSAATTLTLGNSSDSVNAQAFSLIPGWTISGQIVGAGGETVSYSGTVSGSVGADIDGNYSISGLQNGSYTVTPTRTNYTFSPASLPATVSNGNVTLGNFTAKYTGAPFAQTIVRDSFSRANSSTLGTNWTAVSDTVTTDTLGITSDAAEAQSVNAARGVSFWSANTFQADQYAEVIVSGTTGTDAHTGGACVRCSSGGRYEFTWNMINGGTANYHIAKDISGTFTNLAASGSTTGTSGDLLRLEVVGNVLNGYVNGTLLLSVTDTSITSGSPGILGLATNASRNPALTAFEGGNLVFSREGTVIASGADGGSQEPNVLYEANPKILTANADGKIWKIWYTDGWGGTVSVFYAESNDGVSWTPYSSNPVISNAALFTAHGFILHNGATYYAYYSHSSVSTSLDQWTSPDGVTWTLANASVISVGSSGAWDVTEIANPLIWISGGTWYMLYTGRSTVNYAIGLATSPDGVTWTKYVSNPVIPTTLAPGPDKTIINNGGTWYLIAHAVVGGASNIPTDLFSWSSPDLHTWTACNGNPFYERVLVDEGANNANGQVADACLLDLNGSTYMYYDATNAQSSGHIHINLATAPFSRLQLLGMIYGANIIAGNCGVPGATITATGAATVVVTSDVNGNYVIPINTTGSYTITPSKSGYNFSPLTQNETVSSSDITGVNFGGSSGGGWTQAFRKFINKR